VKQQCRGDTEGDDVRKRIELAAERAAAPATAGEVAVDRVERRRGRDGGEGLAEAFLGDQHERHDAGQEARARGDVREVDERPHGAAPACT
jgi:hypothetical protein